MLTINVLVPNLMVAGLWEKLKLMHKRSDNIAVYSQSGRPYSPVTHVPEGTIGFLGSNTTSLSR